MAETKTVSHFMPYPDERKDMRRACPDFPAPKPTEAERDRALFELAIALAGPLVRRVP